jgi:hypothetical protein
MKYKVMALALTSMVLIGCDISSLQGKIKHPAIYLGAGSVLQVSEQVGAEIYGHEECPDGKMPVSLFGSQSGGSGCALLTGKESVIVFFHINGERIDEVWTVSHGNGTEGKGISLARPNGWVIHEPEA